MHVLLLCTQNESSGAGAGVVPSINGGSTAQHPATSNQHRRVDAMLECLYLPLIHAAHVRLMETNFAFAFTFTCFLLLVFT